MIDLASLPLAAILTIVGMVVAALVAAARLVMRVGVLEFKVATMWNFQMRRGFSEVVNSGIGSINSPLQFKKEAVKALDPLRDRLIVWGKEAQAQRISDAELLLLLEAKFGEDLLQYVCIPYTLSHGACLLLALTIATGHNAIELVSPSPPRNLWRHFFLAPAAKLIMSWRLAKPPESHREADNR